MAIMQKHTTAGTSRVIRKNPSVAIVILNPSLIKGL
jgi:hypothetical protein